MDKCKVSLMVPLEVCSTNPVLCLWYQMATEILTGAVCHSASLSIWTLRKIRGSTSLSDRTDSRAQTTRLISIQHLSCVAAPTTWTVRWRTSAADPASPASWRPSCPSWSTASSPTANTWRSTSPFCTSSPRWERRRWVWTSAPSPSSYSERRLSKGFIRFTSWWESVVRNIFKPDSRYDQTQSKYFWVFSRKISGKNWAE